MITVYSKPGRGSTFNIYLPASDKEKECSPSMEKQILQGSETILLVDDEVMILELGKGMLAQMGYRVHVACGGEEAVAFFREKRREIQLVVLDLIMPKMDGGKTFDVIRGIDPSIPVILSSGYALNRQSRDIMEKGCNGFIQKPFNIAMLSEKVREVLDAEAVCS